MKYQCGFKNPKTDERRTVSVTLTPDEVAKARAADNPELHAKAFALRNAYREIGADTARAGLRHIPGEVRLLQ